eukprot:2231902-Amphidinium_carterae.1
MDGAGLSRSSAPKLMSGTPILAILLQGPDCYEHMTQLSQTVLPTSASNTPVQGDAVNDYL